MGSASKASSWAVAAGVAAVEALKDQAGLCRWNYALRTLQQHARAKAKSLAQPQPRSDRVRFASGASVVNNGSGLDEKMKMRQAERAERVYHLVCWGPN